MSLKPMLSALLIAAIPMAAQAGQAPALTSQLNEPLATQQAPAQETVMSVSGPIENEGSSTAMAKARATLKAQHRQATNIELTGDPLTPAKKATS
ncbi:hypothetical protein IOC61_07215 [Halomonas sp. KAO]|uniref:hypothetical protein n=1 Tax=Halomonas sp. KAO TaxID=2783858 RepID=UPI00189E483B|nr:hypothetical protein [Halomonas sp. KAO]MBF7053110.1 hypothetical protein [Halomonas sp. KAO]